MGSTLVQRFCESMRMDHERWHDGTGYALELLAEATPEERAQIESLMTSRAIGDWRDIEALAALDTPRTRALIRRAFTDAALPLRVAFLSHAPALFSDDEHTEVLVAALRDELAQEGLVQAMLLVESHHPPAVVRALLDGVRTRDAATAAEFAMMLLFLHGQADSLYDMEQRPFLLRFQDEERDKMYAELCARIGLES